MRRGRRIQLYVSSCKRCGKPLTVSSGSFWGANAAHKKFSGICEKCITPKERKEMQAEITNAVHKKIR